MLLDFQQVAAKYELDIRGLVHCGAHLGEEGELYRDMGIRPVYWVEANPKVFRKIRDHIRHLPRQELIEALLWSEDDIEMPFNVTNHDGMSSSILQFGELHLGFSPDTWFEETIMLRTTTIDSLVSAYNIQANTLVMDLQGIEGRVLRGASKFLETVDVVYTEVNAADVYQGATRVEEIDALLPEFDRVETRWVPGQFWGDAVLVRRER